MMKKKIVISIIVICFILTLAGVIAFCFIKSGNKSNEKEVLKAYVRNDDTLVIVSPDRKVDAKEVWTISDVDPTETKKYIEEHIPCPPWHDIVKTKTITKIVIEDEIYPVDMSFWFNGFKDLVEIEGLDKIKTTYTLSTAGMFLGCSSLTELDLSTFDTRGVESMAGMFNGCTKLKKILVNEQLWSTDNVTHSANMFNNTISLVGGNGTVFNSNIIDKEYARIDTLGQPGYLTGIELNH